MLAALGLERGHTMRVETVDALPPGPHDVVVQIGASGVCHTDLAVLNGGIPMPLPLVLGHEGAGTVIEVGSAVTSVRVGDRVIGSVGAVCGRCWYCVRGKTHLCESTMRMLSTARIGMADGTGVPAFCGLGTFAETMTSDETCVVRVDTDLPDEQLALIGCAVTTGLGAVFNTAAVAPGSSVAVVGCGGVGQAVVQGARIAGAARIIAIDPAAHKREMAGRFGASEAIDPTAVDAVEEVRRLTGGRGADYTFEVVGRPETMVQAYEMTVRGGTIAMVGMPHYDDAVTFPAASLVADDKRICGSLYGGTQSARDLPLIVDLAETGRLDLAGMVTRTLRLPDVNDAVRAMEAGEEIRSVVLLGS